jgi:hypothetical protein
VARARPVFFSTPPPPPPWVGKKTRTDALAAQVVLLRNEKDMAEQDVSEIHDAMARLEADTRNPRLLSVRRAGQMQHIMYEIEELEQRDLDGSEMARLRTLHEELFNIFEDTLCYLKGGMIQLTAPEVGSGPPTLKPRKPAHPQ